MITVFGKIEPLPYPEKPYRITQVTQFENTARVWWLESLPDAKRRDVLMVCFPEVKHELAMEFVAWLQYQPALIDVVAALQEDGVLWKMWSVENGYIPLKTPFDDEDAKFLSSLRIKWEDGSQTQSGLRLVQTKDGSVPDPPLGSGSR
jgi:hypothetical protein